MRYIVIFVIVLCSICKVDSCKVQDNNNLVDALFESRKTFILNDIPDIFFFYYKPFIELDNQSIADTLNEILNEEKFFFGKNYYLIEFVPEDYRSKIYGVFWTNNHVISYKWDNIDKKIDVINGEYLEMSKPFIEDVEKWDGFITNRSYRYTSIAGASYVFCSKVLVTENKLIIKNAVFREYNKEHFEFYLKEKSNNNFKAIKITNPDF